MEITHKGFFDPIKNIANTVSEDNLFLLSSSISYYSALALAPFALILLSVASFISEGMQQQIIDQASAMLSPQVGTMVKMVFANVNQGVNIGSVSGAIGAIVLLSTASIVFLKFRYSFDVIYGYNNPKAHKSLLTSIKEKLFAMFFVLMTAIAFILSLFVSGVFLKYFGQTGSRVWTGSLVLFSNFIIYLGMFTAFHHYVPTHRYPLSDSLKKAALTSIFFMLGNFVLAIYLKNVAVGSVYGAAGTMLVFLTWTYYSSFIIFLSVVFFLIFKKTPHR